MWRGRSSGLWGSSDFRTGMPGPWYISLGAMPIMFFKARVNPGREWFFSTGTPMRTSALRRGLGIQYWLRISPLGRVTEVT